MYPSVSFVHSSIAASYGCFSLCNPKNATTFLVVDIGSHSCKCILFFADANHIKILKFKESFEVNGDLADRVLFDTVRDSMDHIGSFSDAENASIYRSLNKDKNLFSENEEYSSSWTGLYDVGYSAGNVARHTILAMGLATSSRLSHTVTASSKAVLSGVSCIFNTDFFTRTFCVLNPIVEKRKYVFTFVVMEYFPSRDVTVPLRVPSIVMDTPARGCPVEASVTMPDTVISGVAATRIFGIKEHTMLNKRALK